MHAWSSEAWTSGSREMRPLDKVMRRKISMNWQALLTLIDFDSRLLELLQDMGCVSRRQRVIIQKRPSAALKTEKLLEFMMQKSLATFDNFAKCLKETKQSHVLGLLQGTTGNVHLSVYCIAYYKVT
jgi:hypothetical protein